VYRLFILLTLFCVALSSQASIRKSVTDSETVTVNLSTKDPNIVSIKNDRIEKFSAVKGALVSSLDSKLGVLTLKPTNTVSNEPFSVVVFTEKGKRYTLMVVPVAIPSQDVILVPESIGHEGGGVFEQRSPYTETVVALMKHMANNTFPEDYKRVYVNEKAVEFLEGNLSVLSIYQGENLKGEILEYVYKGLNKRKLSEKQFYTSGVMAIALSRNVMGYNEKITVFRVLANG